MAGVNKVLYIVVVDNGDDKEEKQKVRKESFRYTRPVLQSTLQLMGCKARHAFKVIFFLDEFWQEHASLPCFFLLCMFLTFSDCVLLQPINLSIPIISSEKSNWTCEIRGI